MFDIQTCVLIYSRLDLWLVSAVVAVLPLLAQHGSGWGGQREKEKSGQSIIIDHILI